MFLAEYIYICIYIYIYTYSFSLQSSFGDAILEAIAWTYENYATQYLGKLDTFLGLGGR